MTTATKPSTYSNRGKAQQKLIKLSAELQEDRGLHLDQTSQGFAATGRTSDGQVIGRATTVGPLDFAGYLARPGRWAVPVEFDSKATHTARLDLAKLPLHQIRRLGRLSDDRVVSFLLVGLNLDTCAEYYAVTWTVLGPVWRAYRMARDYGAGKPTASIGIAQLRAHAIQVPTYRRGSALRLDLVTTIETLIEERTKRP